jgi:hypothetical protein
MCYNPREFAPLGIWSLRAFDPGIFRSVTRPEYGALAERNERPGEERMADSADEDLMNELKATVGKWLALDRDKQIEVWNAVGFDLFLGFAKLNMALLDRVGEMERRLGELEKG